MSSRLIKKKTKKKHFLEGFNLQIEKRDEKHMLVMPIYCSMKAVRLFKYIVKNYIFLQADASVKTRSPELTLLPQS